MLRWGPSASDTVPSVSTCVAPYLPSVTVYEQEALLNGTPAAKLLGASGRSTSFQILYSSKFIARWSACT